MTVTLVLVACAALALLFFVLRVVGFGGNLAARTDSTSQIIPVDVDAFRNLVDPSEEAFLRTNLPPREFRAIHRERMLAAVQYLGGAFRNAAVLLQLGQAARRSGDPQVSDAGRHLVDNAVRLRFYALLAMVRLYARIAFPGASLEPAGIVNQYEEMSNWATLLGRLQHPKTGALASRTL
jgi:hypothetical protein